MQLLLLKTVPNLGNPGDLVEVKGGYARNYLLPKGFAIVATPKNVRAFRHQQQVAMARRRKFLDDMQVLAKEIQRVRLSFEENVGPQGKLYGAVTNRRIAEALNESLGTEIDRRKVILDDPIREPGSFEVEVRLDREVRAVVKVEVIGNIHEPASSGDESSMETSGEEADSVPEDVGAGETEASPDAEQE